MGIAKGAVIGKGVTESSYVCGDPFGSCLLNSVCIKINCLSYIKGQSLTIRNYPPQPNPIPPPLVMKQLTNRAHAASNSRGGTVRRPERGKEKIFFPYLLSYGSQTYTSYKAVISPKSDSGIKLVGWVQKGDFS